MQDLQKFCAIRRVIDHVKAANQADKQRFQQYFNGELIMREVAHGRRKKKNTQAQAQNKRDFDHPVSITGQDELQQLSR